MQYIRPAARDRNPTFRRAIDWSWQKSYGANGVLINFVSDFQYLHTRICQRKRN